MAVLKLWMRSESLCNFLQNGDAIFSILVCNFWYFYYARNTLTAWKHADRELFLSGFITAISANFRATNRIDNIVFLSYTQIIKGTQKHEKPQSTLIQSTVHAEVNNELESNTTYSKNMPEKEEKGQAQHKNKVERTGRSGKGF